jgi:cytosine permease
LLAYSVPAAWLGVRSGLTYALLTRQTFGLVGTWIVSFNAIWLMSAWYALDSVLLADALKGLFSVNWSIPIFAAILSFVMAINNYFGFKGVANFARYFAAPLLVLWVAYTVCKVAPSITPTIMSAPGKVPFPTALTLVSSFVIGFAVWGNEPDYWRYGKANRTHVFWSLAVSLMLGEIIFPAAGWMVAHLSGITDYIAATNFMNDYSFGGIAIFAALVLIANYFAANDSNMYGMINAVENLKKMPHRTAVFVLATASSIFAYCLALAGSSKSLESIASLNCIVIPVMTVIMLVEEFVVKRHYALTEDISRVIPLGELPRIRWPAFIAANVGLIFGILTSGIIPGLESWYVGICSVQSWLVAGVLYYALRAFEIKRAAN